VGKVRGTLLMIALGYTGCATTGDRWPGCDFNRPGIVARIASHPLARLERTLCLGWCPVYAVEIDIDGQVAYKGRDFVMTQGTANGELSDDGLQSLRGAVLRSRQAQMPQE
jgi:hypothetical protein